MGDSLPDVVRWISWGYWNFVRACDQVHFERATKQRYAIGPVREDVVQAGLNEFASSAAILDEWLCGTDWLVGNRVTYADFRIACVLPFADLAGLPLQDFPRIEAWHGRLMDIPAWRDPFAGLNAPELPPIRSNAG
jgi:glutathione S-transferase